MNFKSCWYYPTRSNEITKSVSKIHQFGLADGFGNTRNIVKYVKYNVKYNTTDIEQVFRRYFNRLTHYSLCFI